MPVVNKATTGTNSRDLFPGVLELMTLESLRRKSARGYAPLDFIIGRWSLVTFGGNGTKPDAIRLSLPLLPRLRSTGLHQTEIFYGEFFLPASCRAQLPECALLLAIRSSL